jgi:hypothetical protein
MLPFYLAFAAVFFPFPAAGQNRAFTVESEVAVRADSFACKETSELDRLLQCNQCGGFASGTHLYNYLKANKWVGLTAGPRARVLDARPILCIYDLKDNKKGIYPCAWTRTDMLSQWAVSTIRFTHEQRNRGLHLRCHPLSRDREWFKATYSDRKAISLPWLWKRHRLQESEFQADGTKSELSHLTRSYFHVADLPWWPSA